MMIKTTALTLAACLAFNALATSETRAASETTPRSECTDAWVVPPVIASGTHLPSPAACAIKWRATGAALEDDVLLNDSDIPVKTRLTGTIRLADGKSLSKTFHIQVLGRTARHLIAYARTPTTASAANQPVIARSLHLALGSSEADARPLNANYGVLFAIGEYIALDRVELRGIASPSLFYFADGSLGVIATRVTMAGAPDAQSASGALIFKASPEDPTDFTELGLINFGAKNGVVSPRAVWDSSARHYVVSWQDKSGAPYWTTVENLARTEKISTSFFPENGGYRTRIATNNNVGALHSGHLATTDTPVPASFTAQAADAEIATDLPVTPAIATAFSNRFDRITNTGATVEPKTIRAGQTAGLADTRVRLVYSDGSSVTRAVDWSAQDLKRLNTAAPGIYQVHGTVRQQAFPQIFADNRADPTIYRYVRNGVTKYLFVATDDTNNDNVGSVHLPLRVADSLADLADVNGGQAREIDLLNRRTRMDRTAEGRVIAGCYWAPEIHEIGGRLSILFAPCFNPTNDLSNEGGLWSTVESHIMQLREGGDPGNPDDWSKPTAIHQADGSKLGRTGYPNISLDMSYFEVGGQAYYIWSQRYIPQSGPLGDPLTWIAKVDPAAPTRLLSAPVPLIAPNRSSEENLAEGGFAVMHNNRINIIYSSSTVSPTYVVSGIWADASANLTDINSWHKWTAPLQKSVPMPEGVTDYLNYEQGPGHGEFTTDDDGNTLYVYHTWGNGVNGNGRDTRVRRIHWAADQHPVLDMTPDEEVAPANRAVTLTVTVRPQ
ncbi:MAG: family 43 glycosylhydrolase [Asticcacaulis sp.]|uniref:family 43 glycosylhydrolase n=1 Tax=Asticcacaulis sp. TaxID=1872648 RepID=UPI0039E2A42D